MKTVIKKYENRRLYDTSASRYVNLSAVAELIREGAEVQVIDANSGEDLTRLTLTQIIMEDAKGQPAGLPLELLRQLIVASDRARQDFMMWYLKTAFETYQSVQAAVQNQLSEARSAAAAPLESMRRFFGNPFAPEAPVPAEAELKQLRERVAELEARLEAKSDKRRTRKRA